MQIKIRTLTPIWTGDVNRECTKLRETSIIGSLRWWFEAIVRGFNGNACDSVNEKCEYNNKEEGICAVCKLFGTTGWAKRFKFYINQSFRAIYQGNLVISGNRGGWYYPSGLISCDGEFNEIREILPVSIKSTQEESKKEINVNIDSIFKVLFTFISKWGMICGKTAIGYGVVESEDENCKPIKVEEEDVETFFNYLKLKENHGKNAKNTPKLPKLNEMFFVKLRFDDKNIEKVIEKIYEKKENIKQFPKIIYKCNGSTDDIKRAEEFIRRLKDCYGFIPVSAMIRKKLREILRDKKKVKEYLNYKKDNFKLKNLNEIRHFIMGELGRFSAINISHIYWNCKSWELRIWGWVPKSPKRINEKLEINRDDIMILIKKVFNNDDAKFWNECIGCVPVSNSSNKIIIEYPDANWNFIDFGQLNRIEDIKKAFTKMVKGDEK